MAKQEAFQHLQTERRFDLANGPHAPLTATVFTDASGITGFKLSNENGSLHVWREAFDSLAEIVRRFDGVR